MPVVTQGLSRDLSGSHEADVVWVAIYLRVSTDEQAESGFGLDVQEEIIRAYIARFPTWRVFRVYRDEGVSGTATEREDLGALIDDAKNHPIQFAVVAYLSRQSREEYVGYFLDRQLAEVGVTVVSATQDANPYQINHVARGVQRIFDAEDRRNILNLTNNGRQKAAEGGYWTGGPAPYGYEIVGQGRRKSTITVCESEANVLCRAAELMVDLGLNLTEASNQLNREGLVTRSGGPWTPSNLRQRLTSDAAAACSVFRKVEGVRGGKPRARTNKAGDPLLGATVVRQLPEILSPERFKAVQRAIARNARQSNGKYELTGFLFGSCGHHYRGTNGGDRRYKCTGDCKDVSVPARPIEELVWQRLAAFLTDRARLRALADEWVAQLPQDHTRHQQNKETLITELAKNQRMLEQLTLEMLDPDLDPDEKEIKQAAKETLLLARKEKREALGQVTDLLHRFNEARSSVEQATRAVEAAKINVANLGFDEKRALFQLLRIEVRLDRPTTQARVTSPSPVEVWHRENNILVPDDPDDVTWERVLSMLAERGSDLLRFQKTQAWLRPAVCAMLLRLRTGSSWARLPGEFAGIYGGPKGIANLQARLWKQGHWPEIVRILGPEGTPIVAGVPGLTIVGHLSPDLLKPQSSLPVSAAQSSRGRSLKNKLASPTDAGPDLRQLDALFRFTLPGVAPLAA
jgi:DNA invertase Pin-like site-specific DNA recombinase